MDEINLKNAEIIMIDDKGHTITMHPTDVSAKVDWNVPEYTEINRTLNPAEPLCCTFDIAVPKKLLKMVKRETRIYKEIIKLKRIAIRTKKTRTKKKLLNRIAENIGRMTEIWE